MQDYNASVEFNNPQQELSFQEGRKRRERERERERERKRERERQTDRQSETETEREGNGKGKNTNVAWTMQCPSFINSDGDCLFLETVFL